MLIRKTGLALILIIILLTQPVYSAFAEPQTTGQAVILMDSKSGKIIYARNETTALQPASTTKILTAIIALEGCKLTDIVKATKSPSLVEPSSIGLKEGESISMENLLYALLVKSANDAAVAIAEHISGSAPQFAELMNKRAKELGAANTNFVNPNGLPDPNHYTTAHDLALFAKHAMGNADFRRFVSTKYKSIPRADDTAIKWLQNHNKILYRYDGANGIKTGYTKEAKQCLVASAAKGNQEFIAVVLGAVGTNVWTDAQNMLDYGFANFDTFKQKDANTAVKTVSVKKGVKSVALVTEKDFFYTMPKGKTGNVSEHVSIDDNITAPTRKGQVLGQLNFLLSGKDLGSVNLIAQEDVPVKKDMMKNVIPSMDPFLAGVVIAGLFVAWTARKRRNRLKRKKRLLFGRDVIR